MFSVQHWVFGVPSFEIVVAGLKTSFLSQGRGGPSPRDSSTYRFIHGYGSGFRSERSERNPLWCLVWRVEELTLASMRTLIAASPTYYSLNRSALGV